MKKKCASKKGGRQLNNRFIHPGREYLHIKIKILDSNRGKLKETNYSFKTVERYNYFLLCVEANFTIL